MQQYWINQDGVQAGPVTLEQLEKMSITPDAYVWRSGLEDWVKVADLPELAHLLQPSDPAPAPVTEPAPEPPTPDVVESQQELNQTVDEEPQAANEPEPEPATSEPTPPEPPVVGTPFNQPLQQQPRPSDNIVWSVIAIIFCLPLGIVAIILGLQVRPSFEMGNLPRAQAMSEWSQWCSILAITFGVGFWWLSLLLF